MFVNMEGFYLLEGHAKPIDTEKPAGALDETASHDHDNHAQPATDHHSEDPAHAPGDEDHAEDPAHAAGDEQHAHHDAGPHSALPIEQREVTAILLRTVDPVVTAGLRNAINEGPAAQAVLPIAEIYQLFANFVTPIRTVLLILTSMICVVSGVAILVSIYNSMSERRHEIAVMRALGAGRRTVMAVVLLESVILSLGGGLAGWSAGHLLIGVAAGPLIEQRTGVSIGMLDFAPPLEWTNPFTSQTISTGLSVELLLIPALILLAIAVGFLPALAAYRTDVARSLAASP